MDNHDHHNDRGVRAGSHYGIAADQDRTPAKPATQDAVSRKFEGRNTPTTHLFSMKCQTEGCQEPVLHPDLGTCHHCTVERITERVKSVELRSEGPDVSPEER